MPVIAKRLSAADASFFTHIAPDVFDEPADAQRLAAYLGAPGHIMVAALDGDTIVGQCAGVIHSDFEKLFIRAEVVSFADLVAAGNMANAKATGKLRIEGKDYEMKDGDICNFRIGG